MTRETVLQIVSLLGALILVGSALAARSRGLADRKRLIVWAIGWVAIFAAAAIAISYFT